MANVPYSAQADDALALSARPPGGTPGGYRGRCRGGGRSPVEYDNAPHGGNADSALINNNLQCNLWLPKSRLFLWVPVRVFNCLLQPLPKGQAVSENATDPVAAPWALVVG